MFVVGLCVNGNRIVLEFWKWSEEEKELEESEEKHEHENEDSSCMFLMDNVWLLCVDSLELWIDVNTLW